MKIHWMRIVITAFLSELMLSVIIMVLGWLGRLSLNGALIGEFAVTFLAGLWIAQKVETLFVFHGVSVGIVGGVFFTFVFLALSLNGHISFSWAWFFEYAVRIMGGGLGAYIVAKQSKKLLSAQDSKVSP